MILIFHVLIKDGHGMNEAKSTMETLTVQLKKREKEINTLEVELEKEEKELEAIQEGLKGGLVYFLAFTTLTDPVRRQNRGFSASN